MDRKYLYLHGRLRTATAISDLVLCAADYSHAYDSSAAATRRAFDQLSQQVVFIASSLQEPGIWRLLREIKSHQLASQDLGGQYREQYLADPDWFAVLPAKLEDLCPPGFAHRFSTRDIPELLAPEHERLWPVKGIWYQYDPAHRGLDALLERLSMTRSVDSDPRETFLATADELEALGKLADPSSEQIERVVHLLRATANRRHFFAHAAAIWLPILWDRDMLVAFDEPRRSDDGRIYVSGWEAGEFVVRSALAYPQVAAMLVESIHTDNWLVIGPLARVLSALPPNQIVQAMPSVERWLDSPHAVQLSISLTLLELLQRLITREEWEAALALFAVLAKWGERRDA